MLVGNFLTKIQNDQVKEIFFKAIYQFIYHQTRATVSCGHSTRPTKLKMKMNKMKSLLSCYHSLPRQTESGSREGSQAGLRPERKATALVHGEENVGIRTVADFAEEVMTELDPARWAGRSLLERGGGSYPGYRKQLVQRDAVLTVHVERMVRPVSLKGSENQSMLFYFSCGLYLKWTHHH